MSLSYFYMCCVFLVVTFFILAGVIINRNKKAVTEFIMVMLLMIVALFFYTLSLPITNFALKVFIHELKFIGVAFFSVAFYVMHMRFFDKVEAISARRILIMCIVPTVTVILALTNSYHHLFRINTYLVSNDWGEFVGVESGALFYIYVAYNYAIYFYLIMVIALNYIKTPRIYRQQISVIFFASSIAIIVNIISVFGILISDFGDATLLCFVISAFLQYFGLIIFRPKRMILSARNMAVNEIKTPIVIFDYKNEFLDANISANKIFKFKKEETLESFLDNYMLFGDVFAKEKSSTIYEFNNAYYSVSGNRLYDKDELVGSVILFDDITRIKSKEEMLRNLALNDYMTKLPNRHAYLNRLAQISEENLPVAVIFINISSMKHINSVHGSRYGDAVIKTVSEAIAEAVIGTGFCARINGDEFVMLLDNTDEKKALETLAIIEGNLSNDSIRFTYGIAVKNSVKENIHIIAKLALQSLYNNKFKKVLE